MCGTESAACRDMHSLAADYGSKVALHVSSCTPTSSQVPQHANGPAWMQNARTTDVTALNLGDNKSMMMRPRSCRFPLRSGSEFCWSPWRWNCAVEAYQLARRGFVEAAVDPSSLRAGGGDGRVERTLTRGQAGERNRHFNRRPVLGTWLDGRADPLYFLRSPEMSWPAHEPSPHRLCGRSPFLASRPRIPHFLHVPASPSTAFGLQTAKPSSSSLPKVLRRTE
jgi:hypothetical protein